MTPAEPTYAAHSAYHVLRSVNTIDYSVAPAGGDAADSAPASPVSWLQSNAVVFGRGNRVHYKNMADTEDVAQQLCKITSSLGNLRLIQCGGKSQPNVVALATSGGGVQLWDLVAKKMVLSWKMKSVTSMCFGENLLTVGDERGTLRHYDPRAPDATKLKEQLKKVTRHQGRILKAAWKEDGKYLATGDQNGLVLVWDARRPQVPLDVGEMVQRRRKMQHVGAVTALAWCPWQTKYLVTGDSTAEGTGTIRVWDVVDESPSSEWPTKIELDAQVTSLHFSPHIRELLSTHGPGKVSPAPATVPTTPVTATTPVTPLEDPFASMSTFVDPFTSRISNSVVVHQFPTMRHVTTVSVAKKNVAGSVLSPNGHRIVFAVPEESQLKVWEVWGKFKAPRAPSLYETCAIR
ncbi:WD40 repeat-like protein [Trametes coccinea BRFM310]|uniref:WD40 repeat-like protein n=1 Tax=Trametes coccinea (strain BRFM310) TaxID=1353009 RepID=A0A1Y2I5I0_TRAC3|nr:WD40 repeat-like protein [Trametes coccinea BRFM310]